MELNMNEPMRKSSNLVLNFRLFFFGVTWIHLVIVAGILLCTDLTVEQDQKVLYRNENKYQLITVWFNTTLILYYPVCFYCDWKEKCNQENLRHVAVLRKIRDIVFTSILFPVVMFADILFWRLYCNDMTLITPAAVLARVPEWTQHSMHTVSIITVFVDLFMVFRQRPKSLIPRFVLMSCFWITYCLVLYQSLINGRMVYRMLELFTGFQIILVVIMCYLEQCFYYLIQWYFIDYVWNKPKTE